AGPVEPEQKDFLGNVLTSSKHLLRLINDVLDLAKVESGKLEFRPEPIELPQTVAEVTAILRAAAPGKGGGSEPDLSPEIGTLLLDPARLKQVLYNYLSNALKFTPKDGRVTVRARPEGEEYFKLEVEDTGPGIQSEDLQKLFSEFAQLESGKREKN